GDRAAIVGEQPRRATQAGANEILVGRDTQDAREDAQGVKRAQPDDTRRADEIDRVRRRRVEATGRAPPAPPGPPAGPRRRARAARRPRAPGGALAEPRGSPMADPASRTTGPPRGGRRREPPDHHQPE